MIKRILKTLLHMAYLLFLSFLVVLIIYFFENHAPVIGILLLLGGLFWISWDSVKSKERKDEQ